MTSVVRPVFLAWDEYRRRVCKS